MKFLHLFIPFLFLVDLAGQPPQEFMPAPCFGANNTMFYNAFLNQVGVAPNQEPIQAGADYIAAIDAEGFVIGVVQVGTFGGFGCPTAAAISMPIAGTDNAPLSSCPPAPYGAVNGDLIDIVIWDASRDQFFTLASQVVFQVGAGGSANTGGCPQENFTVPYVVPSNPMPVVLADFRGRETARKQVELGWTTLAERNSDYFSIQHSVNGEVWRPIGQVTAAGNSQDERNYSFVDATPSNGQNLYRLRQVDFDGTFYYSDVVSVSIASVSGVKDVFVYPNPPVGDQFTVTLSGNWGEETSTVLRDISGRELANWTKVLSGTNTLDLPNLPAGVYQLTTSDATTTNTIRLMLR